MDAALTHILAHIETIEPFPFTAVKVLELSLADEPDVLEISRLVENDSGLATKVLRLANSALSSSAMTIGSMREATVRLGARRVAELVMTTCGSRFYRGYGGATAASHQALWKQSVVHALGGRLLAGIDGRVDPHRAYMVGLLQNMGMIVIDRFLSRQRQEIVELCVLGEPLPVAERQVLGTDHAEIGAHMAAWWKFPDELIDAIQFHHAPQRSQINPPMCDVAHLSEVIAWALLGDDDGVAAQLVDATAGRVRLGEKQIPAIGAELTAEIARRRDWLEI